MFDGNSARDGGGIKVASGTLNLTNCTIVQNTASRDGGGIFGGGNIRNCILWGNTADDGDQIAGSATVNYTCIQGDWTGEGNIDKDPIFANPANNDFKIDKCSPCIDVGDNDAEPSGSTDLAGATRKAQDTGTPDGGNGTAPIVDMGAYEFQGTSSSCQ